MSVSESGMVASLYSGWTKSISLHSSETQRDDSIPQRKYQQMLWFQPWSPRGANGLVHPQHVSPNTPNNEHITKQPNNQTTKQPSKLPFPKGDESKTPRQLWVCLNIRGAPQHGKNTTKTSGNCLARANPAARGHPSSPISIKVDKTRPSWMRPSARPCSRTPWCAA